MDVIPVGLHPPLAIREESPSGRQRCRDRQEVLIQLLPAPHRRGSIQELAPQIGWIIPVKTSGREECGAPFGHLGRDQRPEVGKAGPVSNGPEGTAQPDFDRLESPPAQSLRRRSDVHRD